ncbi:DUF262 domain-containing protein [bacterium]|nr:MAG: DUF262 domain-containing protein [bacterium]
MPLEQEIENAARQVSTDAFSLTIGELVNLYRDGDVKIDPDFQRLFRWDIARKSRLIESILVRIPLPPIFVFELPNSKWEVIDGLQRLSTILEVMGELKDPDTDSAAVPVALIGTQYLPSLRGVFWSEELKQKRLEIDALKKSANDEGFVDNSALYHILDPDLQRAIKRTKIGIQLLEKKSDPKSKFDLFQRLNSGGLSANDQELRNCAIVMVNKIFFERMKAFAESEEFSKLIPLGPTSISKSNHLDNLSKIISFSFVDYKIGTDIEEFVTNAMVDIASREQAEIDTLFDKLQEGIKMLVDSCGYNALRPYREGEFVGRIGRTSIEIILVGMLRSLDNVKSKQDPLLFVKNQIVSFWQSDESKKFSAAGIAGTDRVQFTIPRGIALFST